MRRTRPFLGRHEQDMLRMLTETISSEASLDEEIAHYEHHTGEATSEEGRAKVLAEMRARVDADLEMIAANKRLLEALDPQVSPTPPGAVA